MRHKEGGHEPVGRERGARIIPIAFAFTVAFAFALSSAPSFGRRELTSASARDSLVSATRRAGRAATKIQPGRIQRKVRACVRTRALVCHFVAVEKFCVFN